MADGNNVDERRGSTGALRRHELDWIRAVMILSVVWYHAAQVFTGDLWGLHGVGTSAALREFCFFFHQWRMPLLFCISGAATWTALELRPGRRFVRDRARRLLVPLAFGVLVLLPPQLDYSLPGPGFRVPGRAWGHYRDESGRGTRGRDQGPGRDQERIRKGSEREPL